MHKDLSKENITFHRDFVLSQIVEKKLFKLRDIIMVNDEEREEQKV